MAKKKRTKKIKSLKILWIEKKIMIERTNIMPMNAVIVKVIEDS